MRPSNIVLAAMIGSFLAISGCSKEEPATPVTTADTELPTVDVDVPSQEEADAEAVEDITEEGADEAFKELSREIEQELEGDK